MLMVVWGSNGYFMIRENLFSAYIHRNVFLDFACFGQSQLQRLALGRSRSIGFDGFVFLFRDFEESFKHKVSILIVLTKMDIWVYRTNKAVLSTYKIFLNSLKQVIVYVGFS